MRLDLTCLDAEQRGARAMQGQGVHLHMLHALLHPSRPVHSTLHYSTAYSTVLAHSTVQYRIHYITVQCRIQYSTGQYIQYSAVQYSTVQYSTGCSTCPCCTRGWLPPASAWWPRPAAGTPWSRPPGQRGRTSQWPAYRWVLEVATTFHRTQYVLCIRMFNKGLST